MCNKEKFWPALCNAVGHPEWVADPRFKTFEARFENRPLVEEYLDDAFVVKNHGRVARRYLEAVCLLRRSMM